jgi:hypothetical protein
MAEAMTENGAKSKRISVKQVQALAKAKEAAVLAIEECWPDFERAIHETGADEAASITVSIQFKPGKETETSSKPARVEVVGKRTLPTTRSKFDARSDGGQLTFSALEIEV